MKHSDFKIGTEFICGGRPWRCTDVGTRTIVAIMIQLPRSILRDGRKVTTNDPSYFNGPPYSVPEKSFDEYEIPGCTPHDG